MKGAGQVRSGVSSWLFVRWFGERWRRAAACSCRQLCARHEVPQPAVAVQHACAQRGPLTGAPQSTPGLAAALTCTRRRPLRSLLQRAPRAPRAARASRRSSRPAALVDAPPDRVRGLRGERPGRARAGRGCASAGGWRCAVRVSGAACVAAAGAAQGVLLARNPLADCRRPTAPAARTRARLRAPGAPDRLMSQSRSPVECIRLVSIVNCFKHSTQPIISA